MDVSEFITLNLTLTLTLTLVMSGSNQHFFSSVSVVLVGEIHHDFCSNIYMGYHIYSVAWQREINKWIRNNN